MTATVIVARDGDGRIDRAINPRSQVGDDSTIDRGVHRGAWRRPHTHHSLAEVMGLVVWWLVIGALTIGSVIFIVEQP